MIRGASPSGTVNRETSALHRMCTLAVHWGCVCQAASVREYSGPAGQRPDMATAPAVEDGPEAPLLRPAEISTDCIGAEL